jgi:hypothetical protein
VLELVELQGLRHSLVGVGVGGGEDAGLSLEQVSGGACAAGGWQHRQAGMQLSLWAEPHLSKGFPIHVSLPRPPACPAPPWPHAPQRKRLSIAVELVANPAVIFMDEPTSGLDGNAAAVVMRVTRSVASMKRTVVCTIHQAGRGPVGAGSSGATVPAAVSCCRRAQSGAFFKR